jgi:8-amino-7-oxononanoate synthase
MDLLDKLRAMAARVAPYDGTLMPGATIDAVISASEVVVGGRPMLMFGSNNYLGLTRHPRVCEAARRAIDEYGTGTTGSRVTSGTLPIHLELEARFACLYGVPSAVIFTTGFQANLGVIAGLLGPDDVVVVDAHSHASIYDAARLSGASVLVFRHNSPEGLARKLDRLPGAHRRCLVVIEGLYSAEGDVAPLGDIVEVCRRAGVYLMVDEAHGFGVFGARGLGCVEEQGVLANVDFVVGTFSKALASTGGFLVSRHPEAAALALLARAYLFTASSSPADVAAAAAALELMQEEPWRRERLWENVRRLRGGLRAAGFDVGAADSPIVPIATIDEARTVAAWRALIDEGVCANAFFPPAAPAGMLRLSCSAAHTNEQIERAVEAVTAVGRALGLI